MADPLALTKAVHEGRLAAPLQKKPTEAASAFSLNWDDRPSTDAVTAFLRNVLIRVHVRADRIEVDANCVVALLLLDVHEDVRTLSPPREFSGNNKLPIITLVMPAQLKRTGKELSSSSRGNSAQLDESLARLLTRAHALDKRLRASVNSTIEDIAARENMVPSYASRLLRLTYPNMVAAFLAGRRLVERRASTDDIDGTARDRHQAWPVAD